MSKSRKVVQAVSFLVASVSGLGLSSCGSGSGSSSANSGTSGASCRTLARSEIVRSSGGAHLATAYAKDGSEFKKLPGHVLPAVTRSLDQGKLDDSKDIPITVSLELNHAEELDQELAAIYDPASSSYHHFLKPEEFRAKYAPTAAQISQVMQYLKAQGLGSVNADANGLLVHAVGKASLLGSAFQTELHQYQEASGKAFFANTYEIQVPQGLGIQGVHGLHNYTLAHTHLKKAEAKTAQASGAHTGSGPSGAYSPSDIRSAYQIPSTLDGSGQTLALFELDGYSAPNIQTYESQFSLPSVPLQNVLVDSATVSAGGGEAEVELDIELMIAVAPKASKILVYEGPNSDQGMLDTYNKIASDNLAKSVSTSWGSSEDSVTSAFMQSENTIFKQMAAQGQTIYSAAGDTGANDNGSSLSVDDPSAQPYVVAVGGTSLSTSSGGGYLSETTWNDSSGAGGGGISKVWSIPTWQQGLSISQSKGSSTMRMIPDVALNADINQGYAIYTGGSWGTWGGTSAAAPLWAAFNALVNQQRAANGLGPIGYITPTLYALGASSSSKNDFNDIADNSTNGYFPAVGGYDLATGWGSFKAQSLLQDLSGSGSTASSSCNLP